MPYSHIVRKDIKLMVGTRVEKRESSWCLGVKTTVLPRVVVEAFAVLLQCRIGLGISQRRVIDVRQ